MNHSTLHSSAIVPQSFELETLRKVLAVETAASSHLVSAWIASCVEALVGPQGTCGSPGHFLAAVTLTRDALQKHDSTALQMPKRTKSQWAPQGAHVQAVLTCQHCTSQSLLYGQKAFNNLVFCNEQELRAAGAAIMAKRRTNLLGYSLLTMQRYAAKQASRRHQMHSAEHFHRLHVQLGAFAAWRVFMQVS
jgi:hypothetical protein